MLIENTLKNILQGSPRDVLTIGNFDGIHLGHQKLLKEVVDLAKKNKGHSIVLTYNAHPLEIIDPQKYSPPLMSNERKLALFEELGIDIVLLLNFTQEFKEQTPQEFLDALRCAYPFHTLYLGYDTHIGKNRSGTKEVLEKLAEQKGFHLMYTAPLLLEAKPISSSRIRKALTAQNKDLLKKLLGRDAI